MSMKMIQMKPSSPKFCICLFQASLLNCREFFIHFFLSFLLMLFLLLLLLFFIRSPPSSPLLLSLIIVERFKLDVFSKYYVIVYTCKLDFWKV